MSLWIVPVVLLISKQFTLADSSLLNSQSSGDPPFLLILFVSEVLTLFLLLICMTVVIWLLSTAMDRPLVLSCTVIYDP